MAGTSRYHRARLEIELLPDEWILQPPGYVMVGLVASTDRKWRRLRGRITHDSCSIFVVHRVDWPRSRQQLNDDGPVLETRAPTTAARGDDLWITPLPRASWRVDEGRPRSGTS
jgi:hypothetical protein